jgi:hypothetical protein
VISCFLLCNSSIVPQSTACRYPGSTLLRRPCPAVPEAYFRVSERRPPLLLLDLAIPVPAWAALW